MTDLDDQQALGGHLKGVLLRAWRWALTVTVVIYAIGIAGCLIAESAQVITIDAWGPFTFVAWVALIPTMMLTFCLIVRRSDPLDRDEARPFRRWLYVRAGLIAAAGAGVFALFGLWFWGTLG